MKLYEDRLNIFTPFSWRRSSFAITGKQNFFLHCNNKKLKKKMKKKQTKQKDLSVKMGDLPAYSCYAEMTSRPTMKTRHRSYHMSHHILVDWSSSLPLCYRLLRIRRMETSQSVDSIYYVVAYAVLHQGHHQHCCALVCNQIV